MKMASHAARMILLFRWNRKEIHPTCVPAFQPLSLYVPKWAGRKTRKLANTIASATVKTRVQNPHPDAWFMFTRNRTCACIPALSVEQATGTRLIKSVQMWNGQSTISKTVLVWLAARHRTKRHFELTYIFQASLSWLPCYWLIRSIGTIVYAV